MKIKLTYKQVQEALENGFVSPLNSAEQYNEFEYVGHVDIESPAQVKRPTFFATLRDGQKIATVHEWANVSPYICDDLIIGAKYIGRVVNGWFELKRG